MSVRAISGYEITRRYRNGDQHLDWKLDKTAAMQEACRLSKSNNLHEFRVFPCYDDDKVARQGEELVFKVQNGVPIHG